MAALLWTNSSSGQCPGATEFGRARGARRDVSDPPPGQCKMWVGCRPFSLAHAGHDGTCTWSCCFVGWEGHVCCSQRESARRCLTGLLPSPCSNGWDTTTTVKANYSHLGLVNDANTSAQLKAAVAAGARVCKGDVDEDVEGAPSDDGAMGVTGVWSEHGCLVRNG